MSLPMTANLNSIRTTRINQPTAGKKAVGLFFSGALGQSFRNGIYAATHHLTKEKKNGKQRFDDNFGNGGPIAAACAGRRLGGIGLHDGDDRAANRHESR
jgi:hypothetical protein